VGADGGFKARAGALTLFYLASDAERSVLRAMLAEATTGVRVQEVEEPPGREDEYRLDLFNDSYLLEPADPSLGPGAPIGPDTKVQATPAGRELVRVAAVVERWLHLCPEGHLSLGEGAGPALAALLAGWSSTVLHALAGRPLALGEVCDAVPTLDEATVEERIEMMEGAGLLKAPAGEGGGDRRYEATDWLRRSIAPLLAAARMELRHPPGDTAPLAVADVEAAFRLTLPLLRLPARTAGSCALAVQLEREVAEEPVGVTADLEQGRVVAVEAGLDEDAAARAAGPASTWLDALIDGADSVIVSGERSRARHVVKGLHRELFGRERP
jgi:DNA-binding HxlR family transcriptional regulator